MAQPLDTDADAPSGGVRVHASLPGSEQRSRLATLVSVLLHLLVIYLAIQWTASAVMPAHSPIGDAIRLALGGGGGGGGQGGVAMQHATIPPPTVTLAVVPPPPTVIPPPPTATEPPPAVTLAPTSANVAAGAGTGTGTGGGNGTGTGTGTGSGEGPGTGSGKGGGTGSGRGGSEPTPGQMIFPPMEGYPKELRGKTLDVRFTLSETGAITELKVTPPIVNKDFAKKFDLIMRGYTFRPARDSTGKKVASTYLYTFIFGNK